MIPLHRAVSAWLAFAVVLDAGGVAAEEVTRPLYARPATTTSAFNMDAYVEYFHGLALQEAVALKGWTAGLDFTLPINRSMQFRFLLPLRTEAEAVLVKDDNEIDIDIEGWGGTFRFATLYFEHQVMGGKGSSNRLSYFLGAGNRTSVLRTGTPDRFNHRGRVMNLGVRYDRLLDAGGALLLDTEMRFYPESDDLNPGDQNTDSFVMAKFSGAWIGRRRGFLTPALELTADLMISYAAVSVVPEVFLHAGDAFEMKFGVPVGLTPDAPDWGAQFRLTFAL